MTVGWFSWLVGWLWFNAQSLLLPKITKQFNNYLFSNQADKQIKKRQINKQIHNHFASGKIAVNTQTSEISVLNYLQNDKIERVARWPSD